MRMRSLKEVKQVKGKNFLFKVETSANTRDYLKYEKIRNDIWGDPKDSLAGSRNLKCENFFHEGGSLLIGVFVEEEGKFIEDEEHLVGFSYGYVGVREKEIAFRSPDNLLFYSQYTGVRKEFREYGLGILIKEFQRDLVLDVLGISVITCTYDPLSGVNALRNIHHFGMEVVEYREGYTGEFGGFLNRVDIPCDRFAVIWDLKKKLLREEYDLALLLTPLHLMTRTTMVEVSGRSGTLRLEIIEEINLSLAEDYLIFEIPWDFYEMLWETDVEEVKVRNIPLEWRMKTREAFKSLFQRGYRIVDFQSKEEERRKRNFYVLKKT